MICWWEALTTMKNLKNLEAVFKQFLKFGLRVKLPKCMFMAPSVIYFGLRFSERGLQPTDEKVKAIKEVPTPRHVTEFRSFLGMLATLTNFIPKLSTLAHSLYELLGNKPWNWTPNCEQAFSDVKLALTSEPVLAHYNPSLPVELSVDASPSDWVLSSYTCIPMAHDALLPMRHETRYLSSIRR